MPFSNNIIEIRKKAVENFQQLQCMVSFNRTFQTSSG